MRVTVISALVALIAAAPAFGQSKPVSIREAATAALARQSQTPAPARPGMSPALKWTGIGLLIGGGVTLATGVLVDDACIDEGEHGPDFCNDLQTAWIASGGVMAGTGAALLLIGRARSAPSIVVTPRRVAWRFRF